ncbi:MAG TPA: hypothetical protein VMU59_13315 [Caulobacteraceae bacterium]|nr:hypothetical protein [Caulobacteraceae bacterium]
MKPAGEAIRVTRAANGWTWAVIDRQGQTFARGAAAQQWDAMEKAWSAAKPLCIGRPGVFPEVIVEQAMTKRLRRRRA